MVVGRRRRQDNEVSMVATALLGTGLRKLLCQLPAFKFFSIEHRFHTFCSPVLSICVSPLSRRPLKWSVPCRHWCVGILAGLVPELAPLTWISPFPSSSVKPIIN